MAASPREKFDAAVRVIRGLPKDGAFQPSHEMMLKFYGLFKQATEGPNPNPKPSFWDVVNKAKWEAWSKLGKMPSEEAMLKYVDELKKIIETMPQTQTVAEFMDTLGSFYEIVDEKPPIPISSSPSREKMMNGSPRLAESLEAKLEQAEQSLTQMEDVRRQLDLSNAEDEEQEEEAGEAEGRRLTSDQESEGEEFCDTSDNLSQVSLEPRLTQSDHAVSTPVRGKTVRFRGISQEPDPPVKGPEVSPIRPRVGSSNPVGVSMARNWPLSDSLYANPPSPRGNDVSTLSSNTSGLNRRYSWRDNEMSMQPVDQQISFILSRMEQDMAAMHSRLHFLETKLNLVPLEKKTRFWQFPELSKKTVAFIVIWPFIAHFIISFLSKRRTAH